MCQPAGPQLIHHFSRSDKFKEAVAAHDEAAVLAEGQIHDGGLCQDAVTLHTQIPKRPAHRQTKLTARRIDSREEALNIAPHVDETSCSSDPLVLRGIVRLVRASHFESAVRRAVEDRSLAVTTRDEVSLARVGAQSDGGRRTAGGLDVETLALGGLLQVTLGFGKRGLQGRRDVARALQQRLADESGQGCAYSCSDQVPFGAMTVQHARDPPAIRVRAHADAILIYTARSSLKSSGGYSRNAGAAWAGALCLEL
mmetsp:Transcript_12173/g.32241  ORF Transcript_12173/g.32241 Transcript_12173/m.32241 type:complete len:255 (-) Transcript_12173:399-1163(-)